MSEDRRKAYRDKLAAAGKREYAVRIVDPDGYVVGVSIHPHRSPQEAIEETMKSRWTLTRIARWEGVLPKSTGPGSSDSPILDSYAIPDGYRIELCERDKVHPLAALLGIVPGYRIVKLGLKFPNRYELKAKLASEGETDD